MLFHICQSVVSIDRRLTQLLVRVDRPQNPSKILRKMVWYFARANFEFCPMVLLFQNSFFFNPIQLLATGLEMLSTSNFDKLAIQHPLFKSHSVIISMRLRLSTHSLKILTRALQIILGRTKKFRTLDQKAKFSNRKDTFYCLTMIYYLQTYMSASFDIFLFFRYFCTPWFVILTVVR